MTLIKNAIKFISYFTYLTISVAFLIEIVFRILPTTSPLDLQPISSEDDILRFSANEITTFSLGAYFYKTVTKKTNNYGFYTNYDFHKNSNPDVAIIGDSYVEATQIKNEDTLGEVLKAKHPNLSIYQLGVSGVPISQYIQMVRYAKREFSPKHYVIVLVGNDFDESLCNIRIKEGTWCFDDKYNLTFNRFDGYQGLRALARKSATLRYIVFHLGLNWRAVAAGLGLKDPGLSAVKEYAGNVDRYKSDQITRASFTVIDHFFKELVKMGIENKVTIVLDADRADIYNDTNTKSYFKNMRSYTMQIANLNQITTIDMDPIFRDDYSRYNKKFEFPTDGHWNEHAHRLVSNALIENIKYK
ncbi:hypothetical protein OAD02_02740 [Alphaproteobacteria bacterium]|nr:hypothetical protein [Alphaproteobacteria bacterium]